MVRRLSRQGEEGLNVQPQGRPEGTGRSLSPDEEAEVQAILTEATPEDYDIPLPRWTRKAVSDQIGSTYAQKVKRPLRTFRRIA